VNSASPRQSALDVVAAKVGSVRTDLTSSTGISAGAQFAQ
jgi:hypothetical protein